jgi:hypothetical protein
MSGLNLRANKGIYRVHGSRLFEVESSAKHYFEQKNTLICNRDYAMKNLVELLSRGFVVLVVEPRSEWSRRRVSR